MHYSLRCGLSEFRLVELHLLEFALFVAALGPKGRNVMIEKKFGAPQITKDGVTVAKEVELERLGKNSPSRLEQLGLLRRCC